MNKVKIPLNDLPIASPGVPVYYVQGAYFGLGRYVGKR